MKGKAKRTSRKKRSQTPVALVYFATMILFLVVFGLMASFLVNRLDELSQPEETAPVKSIPATNILFARVNSKNVLSDLSILRISPEKNSATIIPMSSFTVDKDGDTFREVYDEDGIKELKESVEETLDVEIDNYLTVSNGAFDKVADLLGGMIYTPAEEIYYLAENDADDVSFRKGQTISLTGRQIRLLFQYPVFTEGKAGNLEFMGTALDSLVKSAFKQSSITLTNLDNIYNTLTANSDTNLDKNTYKELKKQLKQMLETNAVNCKLLLASGTWEDDKMILSKDFLEQVKGVTDQIDLSSANDAASKADSKKDEDKKTETKKTEAAKKTTAAAA